jgi:hypothetical protein
MTCSSAVLACRTQHILHGVPQVGSTSVPELLRTKARVVKTIYEFYRREFYVADTLSSSEVQKTFESHHSGYTKCDIRVASASSFQNQGRKLCSVLKLLSVHVDTELQTECTFAAAAVSSPEQHTIMAERGESRLKVLARHLLGGGSSSGCPNCACKVRHLAAALLTRGQCCCCQPSPLSRMLCHV